MINSSYTVPQDDYFEWEDLMQNRPYSTYDSDISFLPDYKIPTGYSCFKSLEPQPSTPSLLFPMYENSYFDWGDTQQTDAENQPPVTSIEATAEEPERQNLQSTHFSASDVSSQAHDLGFSKSHDDSDVLSQPTQNVDYLAYPWHRCEADLWASRKHLEVRRKKHDEQHEDQNYDRLRNASWRAVAVGRLKLKKVDPRSFNWLKDQDLTWLHGPFVPQSSRRPSITNISPSKAQKNSVKSMNQERCPSKPVLKHPSLKTLLLRGSVLPSGNPRKRAINFPDPKKRQKQALRFSPEVLQSSCYAPNDVNKRNVAISFAGTSVSKANTTSLAPTSFNSSQQNVNFYPILSDSNLLELNSKKNLSTFRSQNNKDVADSKFRSTYQKSSGRSGVEQVTDDVTALSRALRGVVDVHQRAIPTYPYHTDMPLRATITA